MKWIGLIWLRIGTSGGLLWTRYWTFGFHKMLGSYWGAAQLAAPQGLSSVGRTPWTGDQTVARSLPIHRINAHRHKCVGWASNPRSRRSSERRKVHALTSGAAVIGTCRSTVKQLHDTGCFALLVHPHKVKEITRFDIQSWSASDALCVVLWDAIFTVTYMCKFSAHLLV
jgi:hypothetical protein